MYDVQVALGIIWRRHIDQLRPTAVKPTDVRGVAPDTVEVSGAEEVSLPPVAIQQSAPPNVVGTVPEIPVADQPGMASVPEPATTGSPRRDSSQPCGPWATVPPESAQSTTETWSLNCIN